MCRLSLTVNNKRQLSSDKLEISQCEVTKIMCTFLVSGSTWLYFTSCEGDLLAPHKNSLAPGKWTGVLSCPVYCTLKFWLLTSHQKEWIWMHWGKKGGSTEPIGLPLDPPQIMVHEMPQVLPPFLDFEVRSFGFLPQEFQELWPHLDVIIDGGELGKSDSCRSGSTVVDLSVPGQFSIIRDGRWGVWFTFHITVHLQIAGHCINPGLG